MLYIAWKRGFPRKFGFVLFRLIKKRSFNLLCVLDLFFRTLAVNSVSDFLEEVLERTSLPSIYSILLRVQPRWAGQVARMEDIHMPNAVFFGELQEGNRDRDVPRQTSWKMRDSLHRQELAISHGSRRPQNETVDAHQWERPVVSSSQRHNAAKDRRGRQKERAASRSSSDNVPSNPKCSGVYAWRLEPHSHQRACKKSVTTNLPRSSSARNQTSIAQGDFRKNHTFKILLHQFQTQVTKLQVNRWSQFWTRHSQQHT